MSSSSTLTAASKEGTLQPSSRAERLGPRDRWLLRFGLPADQFLRRGSSASLEKQSPTRKAFPWRSNFSVESRGSAQRLPTSVAICRAAELWPVRKVANPHRRDKKGIGGSLMTQVTRIPEVIDEPASGNACPKDNSSLAAMRKIFWHDDCSLDRRL